MIEALNRAIDIAGSQSELARRIGKKPNAISMAILRGAVPPELCKPIEYATRGKVKAKELRPDIFDPPRPSR